jgi:hypothetical protein
MDEMTATSGTATKLVMNRVCSLCGASLDGRRPHARFCSRACRVEAGRIRAILGPSNPEPYASVAERLEAAQKASKTLLSDPRAATQEPDASREARTAISKLLLPDASTGLTT